MRKLLSGGVAGPAALLLFSLALPATVAAPADGADAFHVATPAQATRLRSVTVNGTALATAVTHCDPGESMVPVVLSGCAAAVRARHAPDRAGLRRDTTFLLSYHVAAIGILFMLPEDISGWSEEQKEEYSLSRWWHNIRDPGWDDDDFFLNYVTHPYWGAAYYVRARERAYDKRASFWYSVAMSTAYEFGAEALFEQPSLQDLVVTPIAGTILGEYFMDLRARSVERYRPGEEMGFLDRALRVATDPIGAINRQVQSWLGFEIESSFYPYVGPQRLGAPAAYAENQVETDWVYGVRVHYRW